MKSDVVLSLLKLTGDVRFIDQFSTCFGKQKYSEFTEAAKAAAFNEKQRLTMGCDPTRIPKEDAFTVLELLNILSEDESNHVLLDHPDFKYSKIGRGRVDADNVLTEAEQQEIAKLTQELTSTKDAKKIAALTAQIAAVTANKPKALEIKLDKNPDGYPISKLTFNQDRPNISIMVQKTGKVDLSDRQATAPAGAPTTLDSFVFRNYAIIKDGLVNVDRLPVRLTAGTLRALKECGMPEETIINPSTETLEETRTRVKKASNDRPVTVVLDLRSLPVINRKMIKATSAKTLFETQYELVKAQAAQKVFKSYKPERTSTGFKEKYGDEVATWLKEQGITDYSGFSPKSVQAESTDFYVGKELKVSLKSLSSLPSVKEARTKIAAGKLTPSVAIMEPAIKEVDSYITANGESAVTAWAEIKAKEATEKCRQLMFELAKLTFTVVVGQTWFTEFKSLDENKLTVTVNGATIEGTVEMKEIEVKI